jgi:uncharacterized membrane protein
MSTIKKINNSSTIRLIVALLVGIAVGLAGILSHVGLVSILIGWEAAVITFILWIWMIIWPMNHHRTSEFAQREDPGRVGVDIILILASITSLGAVGYSLFQAHKTTDGGHGLLLTLISLFSIVVSWVLVHTIYALRYAHFYFSKDEGDINFNGDKPAYSDFLYVAFSVGMTFGITDTAVSGTSFRKTVLRHTLLSYIFGTVIVATIINLIASLGN